MTAHRLRPPARPVTITLDGERIEADEGEEVAQALIAADRLVLARSPKLHRPRGPSCLRGGCDGCLVRVDGVPNVMSCMVPAREGMAIESQNTLGSRNLDLLRVTDWFFPKGMDHHHFLAGVPGLSGVMQGIARRVAGLGTLPTVRAEAGRGEGDSMGKHPGLAGASGSGDESGDRARERAGERAGVTEVDALVVGGGPAGLGAAAALVEAGREVVLVDDGLTLGGSARALGVGELEAVLSACPLGGARVFTATTAAGVYEGDVLIAGPWGAEIVRPRALVLATGSHDGVALFEGNDLPGVFSARAAARLAAAGVAVGKRVVVAGDGPHATALCGRLEGKVELVRVRASHVRKVEGSTRVGGVVVDEGGGERRVRADALVVEAPGAPCFELCEQAGAEVAWEGARGFLPRSRASAAGAPPLAGEPVAPGVWAAGEIRGVAAGNTRALVDDGWAVGRAAAASVAGSSTRAD